MKNFKIIGAIAMLVMITSVLTVQVVMSTPAGKNAGWYRKEFPTFRPQFYAVNAGAVSANASIYVPGIKAADHIFLCAEFDSAANAAGGLVLNNLTDSAYVQDVDSIRIGVAVTANSDLLIGWHKANY